MTDLEKIQERAKATGFIKADGTFISLSQFRKDCSVHSYGKQPSLKRVYFGPPAADGMLSVFPDSRNNKDATKEAYEMICSVLRGEDTYLDPYYIRIREKYSLTYGR